MSSTNLTLSFRQTTPRRLSDEYPWRYLWSQTSHPDLCRNISRSTTDSQPEYYPIFERVTEVEVAEVTSPHTCDIVHRPMGGSQTVVKTRKQLTLYTVRRRTSTWRITNSREDVSGWLTTWYPRLRRGDTVRTKENTQFFSSRNIPTVDRGLTRTTSPTVYWSDGFTKAVPVSVTRHRLAGRRGTPGEPNRFPGSRSVMDHLYKRTSKERHLVMPF